VAGMSCISHRAPFEETAHGRNPDSCTITPRSSLASTWWAFAANPSRTEV